MKYRTTRKALTTSGENLKSCGYCDLQHLLRNHDASAYTCGVYGWNFDVYHIYGLTICTGYRGMPGERLNGCQEYDEKARNIWSWENKVTFEEKQKAVEELLKEFCLKNGGTV